MKARHRQDSDRTSGSRNFAAAALIAVLAFPPARAGADVVAAAARGKIYAQAMALLSQLRPVDTNTLAVCVQEAGALRLAPCPGSQAEGIPVTNQVPAALTQSPVSALAVKPPPDAQAMPVDLWIRVALQPPLGEPDLRLTAPRIVVAGEVVSLTLAAPPAGTPQAEGVFVSNQVSAAVSQSPVAALVVAPPPDLKTVPADLAVRAPAAPSPVVALAVSLPTDPKTVPIDLGVQAPPQPPLGESDLRVAALPAIGPAVSVAFAAPAVAVPPACGLAPGGHPDGACGNGPCAVQGFDTPASWRPDPCLPLCPSGLGAVQAALSAWAIRCSSIDVPVPQLPLLACRAPAVLDMWGVDKALALGTLDAAQKGTVNARDPTLRGDLMWFVEAHPFTPEAHDVFAFLLEHAAGNTKRKKSGTVAAWAGEHEQGRYAPVVAYHLAYACYREMDYDAAAAQIQRGTAAYPQFANRFGLLNVLCLVQKGDNAKALAAADRLLKTCADADLLPEVQFLKGWLYYQQNRLSEARATLSDLAARYPASASATKAGQLLKEWGER